MFALGVLLLRLVRALPLGVESSLARSARADPSLALRVIADEKATTEDVRDRVMRSVPFHYGWLIIMAGAIGSFMTLPGQTTGVAVFFDPFAGSNTERLAIRL